jgi:flagellar basal-body rod protein FlgB
MEIATEMSRQIDCYLDLANSEIKVTAANMANIDTPGYKTLGFDFEAEMRDALSDGGSGRPARSPRIRAVDGLIARPDGNNVSMDREGLNMAEAQLKFRVGVALLRVENQTVMDAIHADK